MTRGTSNNGQADRLRPKNKRQDVLIVGEEPTRSAPTLTWSQALVRTGVPCHFVSEADFLDTPRWLKLLWNARAVIFQWYVTVPGFFIRQLAWAPVMRVPVIRKWSGTDSYNCTRDVATRISALALDRIASANWTTDANLASELAGVGITVDVLAPVLSLSESYQPQKKEFRPKSILVYLPADRKDFYGFSIVEAMIRKFPGLQFIVLADDTHSLSEWPNVRSYGWVDDMEMIWSQVGGLLRLTEHDGTPRMVLEALARRKYVFHNHSIPGCCFVESEQDVSTALSRFSDITTPNFEGEKIVSKFLGTENDVALAYAVLRQRVAWSDFASASKTLAEGKWVHYRKRLENLLR